MARAQENAAAQGDTEFIVRQFPALLEAYEELLMNIGAFLEQRQQKDRQEEALPALPAGALREQVGAALDNLEHFRSQECAAAVESLLRHAMPEEAADALWEIQGQLKLFEDDNAEALLKQLLGKLDKEMGSK